MKDIEKLKDFLGIEPREMEIPIPGIYFLFNGEELVYIGQAKDISRRIGAHLLDKKGRFDHVFYIEEESPQRRTSTEADMIGTFMPSLNLQHFALNKTRDNSRQPKTCKTTSSSAHWNRNPTGYLNNKNKP